MSIQSFDDFEEVIMSLSVLRYIFKSRTKRGLYDLNKKAEPFFQTILNIVYDWKLINLNSMKTNYPAIDLGDIKAEVCIQVTAENSSTKITNTIAKFVENNFYENYHRLILLIITDKKNYTTKFDTKGKFSFSNSSDIKDIDDLLTDIETLPFERLRELRDFLRQELAAIISLTAEPDSLLAKAEKKISLPPQNGGKLFDHLEYGKDELAEGLADLILFYKRLTSLPRKTREYLYFIVLNGSEKRFFGSTRITIQPRKLESLLGLSKDEIAEEFKLLEEALIASYDDDYHMKVIEVSHSMSTGVELLEALRRYSETDDMFLKLIVDCDFTVLDKAVRSKSGGKLPTSG